MSFIPVLRTLFPSPLHPPPFTFLPLHLTFLLSMSITSSLFPSPYSLPFLAVRMSCFHSSLPFRCFGSSFPAIHLPSILHVSLVSLCVFLSLLLHYSLRCLFSFYSSHSCPAPHSSLFSLACLIRVHSSVVYSIVSTH